MDCLTVPSRVWRDMHAAELGHAARALFLLLATSPHTSQAGIAPITPDRWATLLALDVPTVLAGLDDLEESRFVVSDRATGEVLLPAFWGWNFGGRYGMRRADHVHEVVSDVVRAAASGR